jgi:hypothetical protein
MIANSQRASTFCLSFFCLSLLLKSSLSLAEHPPNSIVSHPICVGGGWFPSQLDLIQSPIFAAFSHSCSKPNDKPSPTSPILMGFNPSPTSVCNHRHVAGVCAAHRCSKDDAGGARKAVASRGLVKWGLVTDRSNFKIWLWVKTLVPGWYTNIAGKWMVIPP